MYVYTYIHLAHIQVWKTIVLSEYPKAIVAIFDPDLFPLGPVSLVEVVCYSMWHNVLKCDPACSCLGMRQTIYM